MSRVLSLLRSAGFARLVLIYLGCFIGLGAWLPWARSDDVSAPGWALAVGLDHPFSSAWFLAGCLALFASTLACTWGRWTKAAALHRGQLPGTALPLAARPGASVAEFLHRNGFRGRGPVSFRHRWALHGGWLLHVGLLALIAGIALQQALHDGGAFELSEGEQLDLSAPGAVFGREAGPLAPRTPPGILVALESFDPYLHQEGYSPDRQSRLTIRLDEPARLVGSPDDIEMEDGDTLHIPQRPTSVSILGAVRYATAILYQPEENIEYYLARAGGATRQADLEQAYILKPDGIALASFVKMRKVEAGDAIIVPVSTEGKIPTIMWVKDITTIIGNIALPFGVIAGLFK